ncbi:MAG: cache domain-containing protein [Bacteroidota bacterium]|nr:cache domain-containing protein [Bacteroidota bacterium]
MKDDSSKAEKRKEAAAGKKKGAFPRQKMLSMTLVLLFIAGGIFYYYQHIQRNRDHLTQHNLRHLGTIATVIQERIDAFSAAAGNLDYIRTDTLTKDVVRSAFSVKTKVAFGSVEVEPGKVSDSIVDAEVRLSVHLERRMVPLRISAKIDDLLDVNDIMSGAFTALLITDHSGSTVLFNSDPRRFHLTRLDSVGVNEKTRSFEAASLNSSSGAIHLAGREYRIYMQVMGQYRICALLDADRFETKARSVHGTFFIDAILVLLLLLIAVPLITLHFADYGERIRPLNVLINIGCIIVGAAIAVLLMADIIYGKYDADERDDAMLKALSDSIRTRVAGEFGTLRSMQDTLSQWIRTHEEPYQRRQIFPVCDSTRATTELDGNREVNHILRHYPYFEQLYWLDGSGTMIGHWTTALEVFDGVPLADRDYFVQVDEGASEWIFPHYTRATGEFMVAFSRESSDTFAVTGDSASEPEASETERVAKVAAVDFLPRTLVDVWLPAGFGYMIVDERGDVLFHSHTRRALHENLLLECNSTALRELIHQRRAGIVSVRYWEDEVRMFAAPMSVNIDQSWYLVVYSEQDMLTDMKIGTVVTAGMLYLLFFLPFITGFVVYVFVWDRHLGMLCFQQGMGSWYRRTTILVLAISLAVLTASLHTSNLYLALIAAIVLPHIAYMFVFMSLDRRTHTAQKDGTTPLPLRIRRASAFALHLVCLVLLVWVIDRGFPESLILASRIDAPWWIIPILILFVLADVLLASPGRTRKWRHFVEMLRTSEKRTLPRALDLQKDDRPLPLARSWYRTLLASLVILVGLVPSVIFYRVSADLHTVAYYRTQQHEFSLHAERRSDRVEKTYGERIVQYTTPGGAGSDSVALRGVALRAESLRTLALEDASDLYLFEDSAYTVVDRYVRRTGYTISDRLLRVLMPPVNSNASRYRRYLSTGRGEVDSLACLFATTTRGDTLRYVLPRAFSLLPASGGVLPLLLACALFLSLLYIVIGYGTRRIFYSDLDVARHISTTLAHENQLLLWTTAGDHEKIRLRLKAQGMGDAPVRMNEVNVRTLMLPGNTDIRSAEYIILDDFEYRFTDAAFNQKKLELLEYLLFSLSCRVCILCSVDPVYYFFESDGSPESQLLRDRWTRVLNMFVRSAPRVHYRRSAQDSACSPLRGQEALLLFAMRECALSGMERARKNLRTMIYRRELRNRDEIMQWISVHCRPLFQSLWMTCSRRERLILYRIAHDGFAPYRARKEIAGLLERGLLAKNPALCLFSACFHEYVKEAKTPGQIREWESREATGLWGNIKHPLLLGFVLIAAALFYANPAYFDSTIAILTAMAGAIPLLLRVRGYLTGVKAD